MPICIQGANPNPMRAPVDFGRSQQGHFPLFFAAAAVLALAIGPEISVPTRQFAKAVSQGRTAPVQVAAAAPVSYASGEVFPPFPEETRGASPGRGYVWIPGYYRWAASHGGYRWVWFDGHYEYPPRPRAAWMAPSLVKVGASMIYIGGYWSGR